MKTVKEYLQELFYPALVENKLDDTTMKSHWIVCFTDGKYSVAQTIAPQMLKQTKDVKEWVELIKQRAYHQLSRKHTQELIKNVEENINGVDIIVDSVVPKGKEFLLIHPVDYPTLKKTGCVMRYL